MAVATQDGQARQAAHPGGRKKRANMHEGIGVWCDCCSCEAEPYWAELADEMGVNLSDYEDEQAPESREAEEKK